MVGVYSPQSVITLVNKCLKKKVFILLYLSKKFKLKRKPGEAKHPLMFVWYKFSYKSHFMIQDVYIEATLAQCDNKQCRVIPAQNTISIGNRLTSAIREHIKKYYQVNVGL